MLCWISGASVLIIFLQFGLCLIHRAFVLFANIIVFAVVVSLMLAEIAEPRDFHIFPGFYTLPFRFDDVD